MPKLSVEIAPHEREAMYQTMLTMRAFASLLDSDPTQANKMRIWAQMIEDVLYRLDERYPPPRPEPSVPFRKG